MLLLASASPRRRDLLSAAGVAFTVAPADIDESRLPGEDPRAYVRRVATAKARAVAVRAPGARVIAADTTVALDGHVLGKPADAADATAMLTALSGRTHHVHTAVVVIDAGRVRRRVVTTQVRFRALRPDEIAAYIATGEPFDKAGGYGIQGAGGALVDHVRGSYTNVVGLPLAQALALLGP